jgi:hypothetical protein
MHIDGKTIGTPFQRLKGRTARNHSIGTKLTTDEMKAIVTAAEAQGKSPSEWAREMLLHAARNGTRDALTTHIFTELVGIQMLLMSSLSALLCGHKLTEEEVANRFRQVQKSKATQAQELLTRRAQQT